MTILHVPVVTTITAAILGLLFAVLSVMVVGQRVGTKVILGHGETPTDPAAHPMATPLFVAVRSHANFAEYAPMTLLLIGLIELQTGPTLLVKLLAFGLLAARVMHPIGMRSKAPNPFRAGGFGLSVLVLAVAGVCALVLTL